MRHRRQWHEQGLSSLGYSFGAPSRPNGKDLGGSRDEDSMGNAPMSYHFGRFILMLLFL